MDYETILFEVHDGICTLTLNRPHKRNAFDMPMRRELGAAVMRASADREVRALILTGAGDHFCAGGDIATMVDRPPGADAGRQRMRDNWYWVQELVHMDKPVIAAVDGSAAGAGFNIALAADFILATERASFCQSFARIGMVPDAGGLYLLPRIVGLQAAKEIVFSARTVSAREAQSLGIVYRLVDPAALLTEARALAQRLCTGSSTSLGLAKSILNGSFQSDLRTVLEQEASANGICMDTAYHHDAIDRFLRKAPIGFQPFAANDPLA